MRIYRFSSLFNRCLNLIYLCNKFFQILILLFFIDFSSSAQQTEGQSPDGTKYLIYTPPNYNPTQNTNPLLVTLMGGGEIGDDLNVFLQNNSNRSPAWLIENNEWPDNYPFVVLTPQLPKDESVSNPNDQIWPTELIDEVIAHIISNYTINEAKIYLTGVSLGAKGFGIMPLIIQKRLRQWFLCLGQQISQLHAN